MKETVVFRKLFTISLLLVFLVFNIATSAAAIVEKSDTMFSEGNILYVGGSGPGNYSQIQDAVDDTNIGDTVFVFSGVYAADIIIDKSIYLIGENQETTIIEMGENGISIFVDGVTVEKFTIEKCGGFWHRCGVYIGSNHNTITNVTIANNGVLNGIFIEGSFDNIISNNIIVDNLYFGIRLEYSSQNTIMKNFVSNVVTNGIILTGSSDNMIFLNTIKECTWGGISLDSYCLENKIYHNNFIDNYYDNGVDYGSNIWDDDYPFGGNYWSDYDGEDNDGDGIGDTPYLITGADNEDRYPLMIPLGTPEVPIISGPIHGKVGEKYDWTFVSTDPDGHDIYYWIQWGDGTSPIEWIGPYSSGEEVTVSHTFSRQETFTIEAKAKDDYGLESSWGQLSVSMPRNRMVHYFYFTQLLERFL
ncbi:MAG: NosD domain-containing protein, partial [Candidatus Hodarchaeales archaeon]